MCNLINCRPKEILEILKTTTVNDLSYSLTTENYDCSYYSFP